MIVAPDMLLHCAVRCGAVRCRGVQVRLHGDLIIATIWAFLHAHHLLTHVPAMVRGGFLQTPPVQLPEDMRDCPSWRDPQGAEGQEVSPQSE